MAKAQLNPVFEFFTGKIGNLVFRRAHNGKLSVMYRPTRRRVKWSPKQKAQRALFRDAVEYAKVAMKDPEVRAVYEQMALEKKKNNRPFDMAVSDYCKGNNLLTK